jgi:two-component system response regulator (stage 0 sporulation protein A)
MEETTMIDEKKLERALMDLGHPTHQLGYDYLRVAIQNYRPNMGITKELYPLVAKACCSTPSRVERAIRHNIETAWMRGTFDDQMYYFGNTIDPNRGKPCNGEYIDRLWRYCRAD